MTAFFPLPAWLMSRSDVGWGAKALFAVLARYTRKGTREAYPAIETLVADTGSPRRTVERWLFELEHAGLVERVRTGRACTYRLAPDPGPMPATVGASEEPADSATDGASDTPNLADRYAKSGMSDTPHVAPQAMSTPSSGGVEILVDRVSHARADSDSDVRGRVLAAFRIGYTSRYARAWAGLVCAPTPAQQSALADKALSQSEPVAFVEASLDGYFGDSWANTARHPVKHFVENCERYAAARVKPKSERRTKVREWSPTDSQPDSPPVPVADAAKSLLEGLGIREPRTGAT